MTDEIRKNLVYLSEKLTNLELVTLNFVQENVFSKDERERILCEKTTLDRNCKFWDLLVRKQWEENKSKILQILRKNGNGHCANTILGAAESSEEVKSGKPRLILNGKWWPEEYRLPKAFQERKVQDLSLVEHLRKQITENKNVSTVICQGTAVSGLGGVGKTTTAKWFAQHYQNEYDHIIWIDCGEGSLTTSFFDLANDLKLNPYCRLHLLAKKCFSELQGLKCLCIFDNAECYQGPRGIRHVLPKMKNIHSIITSRIRDWGSEFGDGKIPQLPLDAFDSEDGIAFLRNNLNDSLLYKENQLQELCEQLGNLPLALQIANTTINTKKIPLDDYIQLLQNTPHIIDKTFDDYEKSITQTMKISLDLIKNHESCCAKTAYNILLIFGYIRPDFVTLKLFQEIEKSTAKEIEEACELLEKYSLLTIKTTWGRCRTASIHRLLQTVLRHNSEINRQLILRKILSCEGFVEYKLIPFSFADEEILKEFPKLRVKFFDQKQLKNRMKQFKFTEAVELSFRIKNTMNSFTSDYNYALCLVRSGNFETAIVHLETLDQKLRDNYNSDKKYRIYNSEEESINQIDLEHRMLRFPNVDLGLIDLHGSVKLELISGLLFLSCIKADDFKKAAKITTEENLLIVHKFEDTLDNFIRYFRLHPSSTFKYEITTFNGFISIKLNQEILSKNLKLWNCTFSEKLPSDFQELDLNNVNVFNGNGDPLEYFDITSCFSSNLKKFKLLHCDEERTKIKFDFDPDFEMESVYLAGTVDMTYFENFAWNVNQLTLAEMQIPLLKKKTEMKLNQLHLKDATVSLSSLGNLSHSAKEIKLDGVRILDDGCQFCPSRRKVKLRAAKVDISCLKFVRDNELVNDFFVNEILDFHSINELTLTGSDSQNMNFDLNESFSMNKVCLWNMKILNWEKCDSTVTSLTLGCMDMSVVEKTNIKVENLILWGSIINSTFLFDINTNLNQIDIEHGKIVLQPNASCYLNSSKINFHNVKFINRNGNELSNVLLNNIINLSSVKNLKLSSDYATLLLNMNTPAQFDSLSLKNIKVNYLDECQWIVHNLELKFIPLALATKLQMGISSLTYGDSLIDLSCLPRNIRSIHLTNNCEVMCSSPFFFNNLQSLSCQSCKILSHFSRCLQLSRVDFYTPFEARQCHVDLDIFPNTVRTITFANMHRNGNIIEFTSNRIMQLERLNVHNFPFRQLEIILEKFNAKNVFFNRSRGISSRQLSIVSELMEKSTGICTVDSIFWNRDQKSDLKCHIMSSSRINNKISVLEENEFVQLLRNNEYIKIVHCTKRNDNTVKLIITVFLAFMLLIFFFDVY